MTNFKYTISFCLAISIIIVSCSGLKHNWKISDSLLKKEAMNFQDEMNTHYKNPVTSPLDSLDLVAFEGLDFFDVNDKYRVIAKLKLTPNAESFEMATSTDRLPVYRQYGILSFKLNEQDLRLSVYENVALKEKEEYKDYLFLPFKDATNGFGSYGGGRYLDLEKPKEGKFMVIDFNKAYNPYCAYSDKYSCPVPPRENHLDIEIKAGVKRPKGH